MQESEFAGFLAFLHVVEQGSFVRASGQLGLTASAVGQRVRKLESRLGTRLLNRTTRSVKPTVAGLELADRLRAAFHDIEAATRTTLEAVGKVGGIFRITASAVAAELLIAPHVGEFRRRHPELRLTVSVNDRLVNVVEEGFDAGLRRGDLVAADMIHQRVSCDTRMVVVASPSYLAGRPSLTHPRQLQGHDCITVSSLTDTSVPPWRFKRQDVVADMKIDGALVVDTPGLALAAAVSGAGVAYLAADHVKRFIDDGRLTSVLGEWDVTRSGFFLYYPGHRHILPAARAFGQFLRSRQSTVD